MAQDDGQKDMPFVKGVRHLGQLRVQKLPLAGRSMHEQIEHIRREGVIFSPKMLRNSIIGGLEIRPHKGPSENVVIVGCACYGITLLTFCRLMQRMGIDYTFLEKENCCGAPMLHVALLEGQDRAEVDAACDEFTRDNVAMAREKGAKNIIFFCPWCLYVARKTYPNDDSLIFFPEILDRYADRLNFQFSGRVGYFGGTPHRKAVYDPEDSFDLRWDLFPKLLNRVQGLEVVKVPRYCCMVHPELIFQKASQLGLNTIVTPCVVCHGGLSRKAPPDIKMRFITDFLLDAVVGPNEGMLGEQPSMPVSSTNAS